MFLTQLVVYCEGLVIVLVYCLCNAVCVDEDDGISNASVVEAVARRGDHKKSDCQK